MNVNELRERLEQAEKEAGTIREQLAKVLPRLLALGDLRLVARNFHAEVSIGSARLNLIPDHAKGVRDWFLALHPLDPAPDAGWVSVEERLPASPNDVLVWTQGRALLAWHDNTRAVWFERSNERRELSPVTHWRDLPAPPASERTKP